MPSHDEDLLQRHRREMKEFQVKAAAMKKSAPVSDKKRRKEVLAEIESLENQIRIRHEAELKSKLVEDVRELNGENSVVPEEMPNITTKTADLLLSEPLPLGVETEETGNSGDDDHEGEESTAQRTTRAQRRRMKKESKLAENRKNLPVNEPGPSHISARTAEKIKLKKILDDNGLRLVDMPSDGNCLYSSLCHQLRLNGTEKSVKDLRLSTGDFMRENPDEFLPFLVHPDSGDSLSADDFQKYCKEIVDTNTWGSQVELRAISTVHKWPIKVLQAEGPQVLIGEEFLNDSVIPLTVVYHRHELSLGEHYNSVVPK